MLREQSDIQEVLRGETGNFPHMIIIYFLDKG